MNAVIKLDVPEYQIGQEVTVYFKDTMIKRSVCEEDPVVVCKECRNKAEQLGFLYCNKLKQWTDENWFCSDGRRDQK